MGFLIAVEFYGLRLLSVEAARRWFAPVHWLFVHKWFFDELYDAVFVKPALFLARQAAEIDRGVIDWAADGSARLCVLIARIDDWLDRWIVDRFVNGLARWTWRLGLALRPLQSGQLRQYVVMIAVSTVTIFILVSIYRNYALLP